MQQMNFSNSTLTTQVPSVNVAASGVLVVCFVLGVPGNIAVMVWLAKWLKRDEKNFTPKSMFSLAVSDLMIQLCLPTWIWSLLNGRSISLFLCKFLSYVVYWGHYSSTLCVILLSIQRYVQVLHSQKWAKLGGRGQKLLLSSVWVLSAIFASYVLVQYTEINNNGKPWCEAKYRTDTERLATLFWEVTVFMVAFLLLAYFYFFLYQGVNQSVFFQNQTMSIVLTRIVVAFFVFWIPYVINNILLIAAVLLKNKKLWSFAKTGTFITQALTLINCCVNPFLYAFSALKLRRKQAGSENS